MNRFFLPGVLIGILLLVFCHRIWDVGPTLHDDAAWRLYGHQGHWHVVTDWAKSQGRIFAFVSGGLIYLGTSLQGSTLGTLLHVLAFATCFASFHAIIGVYFNTRLAMMTAVVNLALFAIRWEGSVVTTYPIFSWTLGAVFVASVYWGRRFSEHGKSSALIGSLVLLFLSLNIHEGMILLFSVLAVITVLANYSRSMPELPNLYSMLSNRRFVRQFTSTLGVIAFYLAGYVVWRLIYPSQYEGNKVGSLNPLQIVPVLMSFSTTGTLLSEFVYPYRVNFTDAISLDSFTVVYKPLKYLLTSGDNLVALLSGVCAAVAAFSLSTQLPQNTSCMEPSCEKRSRSLPSVFVGICIALIPVLPVALVGKYQQHFFDLNIRSYAFTPMCHFGWSLLIATLCCRIERLKHLSTRTTAAVVLAIWLGVLGYCSCLRNDATVADMRRETCRWEVLDHVARILPQLQRPVTTIHAPRLQSGTWFTVLNGEYWSSYMQSCYQQAVKFENASISRASIEQGAAYVDFSTDNGNLRTIAFAALLNVDPYSGSVVADEIGVAILGLDPSDKAQYLLNYRDLERGTVSCRLSQLTDSNDASNVHLLRNVRAVPGSISVSKYSEVHDLNIECGDRVPLGTTVRFGLDPGPDNRENATKWLVDGWHTQERSGTWSSQGISSIRVPLNSKANESFTVSMVASTLTGMGMYDQPQTLSIKIGERIAASRTFSKGDGWVEIQFDVGHSDLSNDGGVIIDIVLADAANPAQLGLSADTRTLGVMAQSMTIQSKSSQVN